MREKFREFRLSKANKERLALINEIIEEYKAEGYTLTLRQLYYQLVSRDVVANKQEEYTKLSKLLKEGRMSGVVDWSAIEDRLRQIRRSPTWENPEAILQAAAEQFALDSLKGQEVYIECWVEKDALSEIVKRAADEYQVPVMVNRGYGSVSMIYDAYKRITKAYKDGAERAVILYLGDHDPSGLDMIRDIQARLDEMLVTFYGIGDFTLEVAPLALTTEQVNEYNPPPNPAKFSDPRAGWYMENFGTTSWEVDALEPRVLNTLITEGITSRLDLASFQAIKQREEELKWKMERFINTFQNFK